jgi:hypothetical protein
MKSITTHALTLIAGLFLGAFFTTCVVSNFWVATDLSTQNNLLGCLHTLLIRDDTAKAKKLLKGQINQNVILLDRVRTHNFDAISHLTPHFIEDCRKQWDNSFMITKQLFSDTPEYLTEESWKILESRTQDKRNKK